MIKIGDKVVWNTHEPGSDHGKSTIWPVRYEGKVVNIRKDRYGTSEYLIEFENGERKWASWKVEKV